MFLTALEIVCLSLMPTYERTPFRVDSADQNHDTLHLARSTYFAGVRQASLFPIEYNWWLVKSLDPKDTEV